MYSLAVVKYTKRDQYIHTKIKPLLHGISIGYGLIYSTTILVKENFNDIGGWNCHAPVYKPTHCAGYGDGENQDGFNEAMWTRVQQHSYAMLSYSTMFVCFFGAPLTVDVSLWMIYRSVLKQEQVIIRYEAEVFMAYIKPR